MLYFSTIWLAYCWKYTSASTLPRLSQWEDVAFDTVNIDCGCLVGLLFEPPLDCSLNCALCRWSLFVS